MEHSDLFLATLSSLWNLKFPAQGLNQGHGSESCQLLTTGQPGNSVTWYFTDYTHIKNLLSENEYWDDELAKLDEETKSIALESR